MAFDTKPNLSNDKFEQFSGETLTLSGITEIHGILEAENGGVIQINSGGTLLINDGGTVSGITASAAGSDTSLQFNNNGEFSGSTDITWNNSIKQLNIVGDIAISGTSFLGAASNNLSTVKIGQDASPNGNGSISIGCGSYSNTNSVGIGRLANAYGICSVAIGQTAYGSSNAVAIGDNSNAYGLSSVAIGDGAYGFGIESIAIGSGACATGNTTIAVGEATCAFGGLSTAFGRRAKSLGGCSTALGISATACGGGSASIGQNTCTEGTSSVSIGNSTQAWGSSSVAIGHTSCSCGNNSVAIRGKTGSNNAVALGVNSCAIATSAIAIGAASCASSISSVAIGSNTYTSACRSLTLGFGDSTTERIENDIPNSIAFGWGVESIINDNGNHYPIQHTTGGQDTTTTATEISLLTITLEDNILMGVEYSLIGRETGGTNRAFYQRKALVYREGGGATLQGTVDETYTNETNVAWNATIDVSGNTVRFRLQGDVGETIDWNGVVKLTKIR